MKDQLTHFERLHEQSADPWDLCSSWYEQRKRAITMASLPRSRYGRALEPGCSVGVLSAALAERCDFVECWDPSKAALLRAMQTLAEYRGVHLKNQALPAPIPETQFDLIVLSEVGYYLGRDELVRAAHNFTLALAPAGDIVACHFRHPIPDGELDGDSVHEILNSELDLPRQTRVIDADFILDVWSTDVPEMMSMKRPAP